ncbi:hypothetical protein KUCAC02_008769 [Chaenocephalus aceratus]|uniref:Uncharacterized protein n=1 Tax=Chaenocephalus aceratus TaxID=36190 RepID=A0ACB9WS99_CHAAC|nr:hypothetical protein KUCAC02_008769 [Chaenocephalus aceratus]
MFGCCLALSLCHPAISKTSSPSRSAISVVPVPEFSDWAPLCHTPRTIHEPSLSQAIPTGLFSITAAELFLADGLSHGDVVITTNDVIRPNLPFALST